MNTGGRGVRPDGKPKLAVVATTVVTLAAVAGGTPAPARADSAENVQSAIAQARAAQSGCAPLKPNPIVARVAAVVNKSYSDWLAHLSTSPPIMDPVPGLKELGFPGGKGIFIGGVSKTSESDAIKGSILEGYKAIPDCSYTDFGVDFFLDEASGYRMVAVVLAGP